MQMMQILGKTFIKPAATAETMRNINWALTAAMNEIPQEIEGFNPDTGAWEVDCIFAFAHSQLDGMEDKNPEMRMDQDKCRMGAAQRLRREKESNEKDEGYTRE
ncbi:hypothetical protein HDU84_009288 [Entophlyctis sp. JEL0112]|nr:hypothetical protein HDU84_009288 [Entophlyctis sp. JEL0112]